MINTNDLHKVTAVVDNNILVDLFELNRLDILFATFEVVSIPKLIYDEELPNAIKILLENYHYELSKVETEVGYETFRNLSSANEFRNLSMQDKIAISIAKETMYYCNSNDALVKKACKAHDILHIGILGVFELALKRKIITLEELSYLANELASERTSCFITKKVVDEFVKEICESQ